MRSVARDVPPIGEEAGGWYARSQKEKGLAIEAYDQGQPVDLDEQLYQAAKPFLLLRWHNKCAYCDSLITNTHPGDVEHYRPKNAVRDENGKLVRAEIGGVERDHPGYWWLAYEWLNLLPSCIDCNRRRSHDGGAQKAGKADLFAIRGRRAILPKDCLDDEDALLLDPSASNFNAEHHFKFLENGTLEPRTEQGRYTCDLLGLNKPREALVSERVKAFKYAKYAMSTFLVQSVNASNDDDIVGVRDEINAMWLGQTSHTVYARMGLQQVADLVRKRWGHAPTFPLP